MLSALLTRLLTIAEKYILSYLIKVATYFFKKFTFDHAVDQKAEALKESGTKPELTPEQKAKEQEDAFDKLVDAANKP